ncbi:MAG: HD domain-containing protein [Burkholderiales bacterium]|nr:HD domain-containing protein [Burkholderiales bacterium]
MLQTGQVARLAPRASIAPALACLLAGGLLTLGYALFGTPITLLAAGLVVATAAVAASGGLLAATSVFVSPVPALLLCALLCAVMCTTHAAVERRMGRRWLQQLANTRLVTIESMAAVAETRHPETGAHIKRTQHYVKAIAEQLQSQGLFGDVLDDAYIALLYSSAPLHDIGKVGMPDHILLKPGRLTPEELVHMRKHASCGRDIIQNLALGIDGDNFLRIAGEIAATHHEKWDGSGYPLGLAGDDIPLSGRIMAVADVYDALISKRCYKRAFPHGVAMSLMQVERGISFDPRVFDAFRAIEGQIFEIANTWRDDQEQLPAIS